MRSLLLALILILITAQVRAQDTNSAAMSGTNAVPVIGALLATNYYDQEVVVTGKVAQVSVRTSITFINLDKRYPDSPFALVIRSGSSKFLGDATVLRGHTIEVKGKVTNYHDRPEMLLDSNDQLTVDGVTNLTAFLQPATNAAAATSPVPAN